MALIGFKICSRGRICQRQRSERHWPKRSRTRSLGKVLEPTSLELGMFSDTCDHFFSCLSERRDTVSSVGVLGGNLMELTHTSDHICLFRHALALDERRVKFLPEFLVSTKGESTTDEHQGDHVPNGRPFVAPLNL